jgi:hypothetical protein
MVGDNCQKMGGLISMFVREATDVLGYLLDNDTGTQIKVLLDHLENLCIALHTCAIGGEEDGEGFCQTNGVRNLKTKVAYMECSPSNLSLWPATNLAKY